MNRSTYPWRLPKGARAVVADCSTGLGTSIVEELCKKGARVLTCSPSDLGMAWKQRCWRAQGFHVDCVMADLSRSEGRYEFGDAIHAWLRGNQLDILVNNAARQATAANNGDSEEDIWDSNFHSMFVLSSICHEQLKPRPGSSKTSSVVNIASFPGLAGPGTNPAFATAKEAVLKATAEMAREWGPDGIRVNCVAPSLLPEEGSNNEPHSLALREQMREQTSLGRTGEVAEVACCVSILCLPISGFISGQVIGVDGGFSSGKHIPEASAEGVPQTFLVGAEKNSVEVNLGGRSSTDEGREAENRRRAKLVRAREDGDGPNATRKQELSTEADQPPPRGRTQSRLMRVLRRKKKTKATPGIHRLKDVHRGIHRLKDVPLLSINERAEAEFEPAKSFSAPAKSFRDYRTRIQEKSTLRRQMKIRGNSMGSSGYALPIRCFSESAPNEEDSVLEGREGLSERQGSAGSREA